jgi:hypothetical protein
MWFEEVIRATHAYSIAPDATVLKLYGLSTLDPRQWEDVHNEDATILDAIDSSGGSVGLDGKRQVDIKDPLGLKQRLELFVIFNTMAQIQSVGTLTFPVDCICVHSPADMDLQTGELIATLNQSDRPLAQNHRNRASLPCGFIKQSLLLFFLRNSSLPRHSSHSTTRTPPSPPSSVV